MSEYHLTQISVTNVQFSSKWTCRREKICWPPRSPDLSPYKCLLWTCKRECKFSRGTSLQQLIGYLQLQLLKIHEDQMAADEVEVRCIT
jgi:hypothetical protein